MKIPSQNLTGRQDATMTPMIDVVFLLLIFFICTASFQIAEQNLPSNVRLESGMGTSDIEVDPELQDLEPIVVKIFWSDGAPRWEVSGESCNAWPAVEQRLAMAAAINSEIPVILDIAAEVPLKYVIDAYDLSRATGFLQIQFAASVES